MSAPLPSRRHVARTVGIGGSVLATVVAAQLLVTALTSHTSSVAARVSRAGSTVCLEPLPGSSTTSATSTTAGIPGPQLCLTRFHTAHLRLGSIPVGGCVELTYAGSPGTRPTPAALERAWSTACPTTAAG